MAGEGVLLPTPGLLSGAEGQAADKCLLALPDGTGVMQIISMNGAKKKKNLCTILLQCRCKTILVSGQIFAQFSFGKTILSIRLRSWSKGPRDLWSSCCGRIVPLTERIRGAQLL